MNKAPDKNYEIGVAYGTYFYFKRNEKNKPEN